MLSRLLFLSLGAAILTQAPPVSAQEQREELPQQVNSPYVEIRPFISGDGTTLYFGRREHPENTHGEKDLQDIWRVQRMGDAWGTPENLGEPVNNRFVNSLCSVSPDEQELLVFNTYKKLEGPLARFRKNGERWGDPQEVVIENFYNHSEYLDFFQSYQANVLLLALEREDTRGEQDLYVSFPQGDDSWTKPLNLGNGINTKKSDFAPFLAADGKTLFFSTYG
jgi:OOP family OmpA-OmpF porin